MAWSAFAHADSADGVGTAEQMLRMTRSVGAAFAHPTDSALD
jgi:hypothetical protein